MLGAVGFKVALFSLKIHPERQIQASDGGVPPRRKEHILRVNILDVNDNPPVIDSPFGYNVSVSEVSTQLLSFHPPRARSDHEASGDYRVSLANVTLGHLNISTNLIFGPLMVGVPFQTSPWVI